MRLQESACLVRPTLRVVFFAPSTPIADGTIGEVSVDAAVELSRWLAVRILGSSHTNPIFVLVDDKPIRASRQSAERCLAGVNQCWTQKARKFPGLNCRMRKPRTTTAARSTPNSSPSARNEGLPALSRSLDLTAATSNTMLL